MQAPSSDSREDLVKTFIAPLRSAILIDDEFPRYEELLNTQLGAAGPRSYDTAGVRRLIEMCRARDLMCDVENHAPRILAGDKLSHVLKSDLVVLDYHLVPTDAGDPSQALSILSRLAESPHANLVVVYTNGDLQRAMFETAIHFRGIDRTLEYAEEIEADLADWVPDIDVRLLYATTSGDVRKRKEFDSELRQELDARGIAKNRQSEAIGVVVETRLRETYAGPGTPDTILRPELDMSTADSGMFWLSCDNVFVTFVKKSPDADVFSSLEHALTEWNPGILRMMLARARTHLEQAGFQHDTEIMGSTALQVGVLYHALADEEPDEQVRMRGLFSRIFEDLQSRLVSDIAQFGHSLLRRELGGATGGPVSTLAQQKARLDEARLLARVEKFQAENVLLALNAFLCSTAFSGSHVTTGTVFRDIDSEEWWLCVSPACELVPRESSDATWRQSLHPCVPTLALRLGSPASDHKALMEATDGRSIFIAHDGKVAVFHVVDPSTKQPVPVMFMTAGEGKTDSKRCFSAHVIGIDLSAAGGGAPKFEKRRFEAVAQLRHEYADRLLQQTGQHTSRIGVDFVKLLKN
jgi:hypothetical protein